MWDIEVTDEFENWWRDLDGDQKKAHDRIDLLGERGPDLGARLSTEYMRRHQSMKELRASKGGALRVLFTFDPRRSAILLLGGDKTGEWNAWYEWAIPVADDLYDAYLVELRDEGVI